MKVSLTRAVNLFGSVVPVREMVSQCLMWEGLEYVWVHLEEAKQVVRCLHLQLVEGEAAYRESVGSMAEVRAAARVER